MDRTANDAQQAAIDARNKLITVSAGAGTGKTWTLASRYASLLTDSNCGCDVENIITLTFTEKAAQEMKERIESVIVSKMSSANESERIVLRNALSHFDDAHISTIHSFASGVLKESALTLGLDLASSIISQPEADELSEELVRRIEELDVSVTGHFEDSATLERILSEWTPQDIAAVSGECEEIHSARSLSYIDFTQMSSDRALENVIEKVRAYSTPKIRSSCEVWLAVLQEIKEQVYDSLKKGKIPNYIFNIGEFMEKWGGKAIESDDEFIKCFIDLMESLLKRASFGKLSEQINSRLGESASEWKKSRGDLLTISKNLSINEIMSNYPADASEREALIKLCSVCWRIIDSKRGENNVLSFTDLIKYGTEGICGKNYRKYFKQIMIDEFQDTDPLQEKMIRALVKNQTNASIFVVGDPKQSIYRFRNADLSIFESYVKECREARQNGNDGVYINMNESFRMRSGLYTKINELFRYIWPRNLGETIVNLKYEDLIGDANAERDSGTLPTMAMLVEINENHEAKSELNETQESEDDSTEDTSVEDERSGKVSINETRENLLKKLTETLILWKTSGLTVWDAKEKCLRPFEWQDCAILTQTRTSWTQIEDAFSDARIPLNIEGNESWFVRGEVMDIINMLRAVAYPDDELSNRGWRSSFLSPRDINEEEFLRVKARVGGGAAVLKYFLGNLSWLENIPVSQRLRAFANMRYASQLAEEYEKFICRSIHGCSEWLLKSLNSKSRFKEPTIADDGKSVRLLTVHASKGLEFPFVIVFGTERLSKGKRTHDSLIASKHLGLFASKHKLFKTFHYALEEQAEEEEFERLLYVASTRAKDSILYCGITDERGSAKNGSWLKYLMDWNESSNQARITSVQNVNEKLTSSLFTEKRNIPRADVDENISKNCINLELPESRASLTRMSATSYALFEWCPRAWRRKYRQGVDIDFDFEGFGGTDRESLSGKDIGSICHWALSKWNFSTESLDNFFPDEKHVEKVIRILPPNLRASYRINSNRERVRHWLANFAGSEIGGQFRQLCSEGRLNREVPFKISVANGIKLTGFFDVFWEDENGVHLRDWKTNPNDKTLELYVNQLRYYSYALHRLRGNLSTVGLVSVTESKLLSIANCESFDINESRILNAVNVAANGQWDKRAENCVKCPWEGCIS